MTSNGANSRTIDCVGCKQRFSKQFPQPMVNNLPTVSIAVATHEKLIICPTCGQAYFWFISQLRTSWDVHPVSEEERRQIEGHGIISLMP